MTSAYPIELDRLARQVSEWADREGRLPSRNQVMRAFKVGGPKARAALDTVKAVRSAAPDPRPATGSDAPDTGPVRLLHSVPAPAGPSDDTPDHVESEPVDLPDGRDRTTPAPVMDDADAPDPSPQPSMSAGPDTTPGPAADPAPPGRVGAAWAVLTGRTPPPGRRVRRARRVRAWPVLLIALGAFVAIWGGWVELGKLTGFGEITPLPGIADDWTINSAITLPLGVEAYAAFALRVWLSESTGSVRARGFAKWSALGALLLGAAGQVAYHLMNAAGLTAAPWQITTAVSCLPVVVLGLGAALTHLMHNDTTEEVTP
ncbi:hypothetical protein FHS29_005025 [Saccharothrix tamanrassetensis]|uniref:Uncharacterized protein n=1 Tax=Saccharothrix tamanrassetensis TaxID=1051531 RepID=A0A841CQU0_9PSEU|nr:ABC transporter permease [Saccharothrix tamanrassetensis]MBB5958417.1 hypothetical protein [Saccharothrix tamanrassetensis]